MIKQKFRKFRELSAKYNVLKYYHLNFCYYMYFYLTIRISMETFFLEELWNRNNDHSDFINNLHYVIHKWKNVHRNFKPNASTYWLFIHYVDYMFSKLLYPGLDAMDYFKYEFYNFRRDKRKTFITEGELVRMNAHFNSRGGIDLEDKCAFNAKFQSFLNRDWIVSYGISWDVFLSFVEGKKQVIVKPQNGERGIGIFISNVISDNDKQTLFDKVKNEHYLIEEIIIQSEILNRINSSSVNTIRVYSVYHNDRVCITGATLRMGRNNTVVDNYSVGGLAAEIDVEYGIVKSRAVCQDGSTHLIHPDSKETIIGLKIPEWNNIILLIESAHRIISELRYVGWDVVVCQDNSLALLEANTLAGVELQQQPSLDGKKELYKKYY